MDPTVETTIHLLKPHISRNTPSYDFGFWILDFGFALGPQSKIQNPKSKNERPRQGSQRAGSRNQAGRVLTTGRITFQAIRLERSSLPAPSSNSMPARVIA